ncbi:MAG: acyl-ACP--UDP-N-acetylglucosamine O-acyltransferase [Lentisphaeria bacterium]|jgi:UDP-N-acetylglucosamine acyltransferase|nr:acyl-ACP--UDP-N-acetylglucosamine O-acyltransferase [Lentisphaeria bacterium]
MSIHPTAIVSPQAELGADVTVGPYAVIEDGVRIGDRCQIGPHAHVSGNTSIGAGTVIHTGANIGDTPQDLHYKGAPTRTEIGANCVLREYVTIHRGTAEGSATVVGNGVLLMAFAHLGHNCQIGDGVVIANMTMVGGHVEIGPRAFVSASCLIHQFVRIGRLAMVGGGNGFAQDIPPFCMLQFEQIQGANVVGLKRAGISPEARKAIRSSIKTYFFGGLNRSNALAEIRAAHGGIPEVEEFAIFIEGTQKGILPGRQTKARRSNSDMAEDDE